MKNYQQLLKVLRTQGRDNKRIIPFKSSFFTEKEWKHSSKEDLRKLLFMEELKYYLENNFEIFPIIFKDNVSNTLHWSYSLKYRVNETFIAKFCDSYEDALCNALIDICNKIIERYG